MKDYGPEMMESSVPTEELPEEDQTVHELYVMDLTGLAGLRPTEFPYWRVPYLLFGAPFTRNLKRLVNSNDLSA